MIADHLTLADVTRPDLANLARLRAAGHMGLMSGGTAEGKDPAANVYAALGAGDSIHVGDVSQGLLAQALATAHVRTALIGDADGDDTGQYQPAALFLPTPTVSTIGKSDGTVADPLAAGGRRIDPPRLWSLTQAALRDCDMVAVHFGDFARIERENQHGDLMPTAYEMHRQRALADLDAYLGLALPTVDAGKAILMLVVPTPPLKPDGRWDRLTPFLETGLGRAGAPVTSATTQTPGLIAARDIAPTVLAALSLPPPIQMTGVPATDGPKDALALIRLDQQTRLNQQAQSPLFWALGLGAAAVIFSSLGLFLSGRMVDWAGARHGFLYGLRLLAGWPLALLLAPLLHSVTLGAYCSWIVVLTAFIALMPSPSAIYTLTALVLVADGLTGTRLVSQSVLSAYALSGIRFYGIGNEYMGVLIAGALLGAALTASRGIALTLWFAFVVFVLSFPDFGAKAGGAITATATFVVAWRRLRGLTVTWKRGVAGVAAGFALVFLWALVGHWVPMRHTHIESAVNAMGQGRLGYIAGVTLRKLGLALRVTLRPGTLLGVLGLVLIGGFARLFLWRQVSDYLGRHPRFAAVWGAGLWGCLVAVLFNDSGIVAAILLLTSLIVTLLHGLYQECALLPSTSATSGSVSPSATL